MNGGVSFHPLFKQLLEAAAELEEMRAQAKAVLGPEVYERVEGIVEAEPQEKRAAFYGTIAEAAAYGSDFSQVETIMDIAGIYAEHIIRRAYGGDSQ